MMGSSECIANVNLVNYGSWKRIFRILPVDDATKSTFSQVLTAQYLQQIFHDGDESSSAIYSYNAWCIAFRRLHGEYVVNIKEKDIWYAVITSSQSIIDNGFNSNSDLLTRLNAKNHIYRSFKNNIIVSWQLLLIQMRWIALQVYTKTIHAKRR